MEVTHNLNVTVVAVGGGFAYGNMGYTHHAIEDIAMLRVLPNLTVVAPGDPVEAACATKALCGISGPGYLRLGRGGEPVVHATPPAFTLGKAITLREGHDAIIISSARTLDIADKAAANLNTAGKSVGLISMPTLSPFDREALIQAAAQAPLLVTVEEHGTGGLGSLAAEYIAAYGLRARLHPLFVHKPPVTQAGSREWLRVHHGITTEAIIAAVPPG